MRKQTVQRPYVSPATRARVRLIRAKLAPIAQFRTQSNKRLTVSHRAYCRQLRKIQKRTIRAAFKPVPVPTVPQHIERVARVFSAVCTRSFPCHCQTCAKYSRNPFARFQNASVS